MPWRNEPYALLLVQKAHETKRLQDKKEYLARISHRLHLGLASSSWNEEETNEAIRHLYTLFFARTTDKASQDAFLYLQHFFKNFQDTELIENLRKIDTNSNWDWTSLQLTALCLDMQPLVQSLDSLEDKIESINWYLFFLGEVRYPPLSDATKHADHYSSLGPILSSRQGICLGTTILFAAVCQRLSIPVVTFTPPGHIFAAIPIGETIRVVETTARGANIPLLQYESTEQPTLTPRSLSAIHIGYFTNKAAIALAEHHFEQAKQLYIDCEKIDPKSGIKRMLSLSCLLLKQTSEAIQIAKDSLKEEDQNDLLLLDIVNSNLPSNIALSFLDVMLDESPFHKELNCKKMIDLCDAHPESSSIRYHGAILLFELHRMKEAKTLLDKAPHVPSHSINWWFLLSTIAHEMHDRNEELRTTIELMKRAIDEKKLPHELIDFGLQVLNQNPDCKELSSLLQKAQS